MLAKRENRVRGLCRRFRQEKERPKFSRVEIPNLAEVDTRRIDGLCRSAAPANEFGHEGKKCRTVRSLARSQAISEKRDIE